MTDYVKLVKDFQDKYDHYYRENPHYPPEWVVELRMKLIEEEMTETLTALDEVLYLISNNQDAGVSLLAKVADGIADSMVVLVGTAITFGLPIDEIFEEVMRSNMTKSTEKNDYGKTIKGDTYEPPNIKTIIMRCMP